MLRRRIALGMVWLWFATLAAAPEARADAAAADPNPESASGGLSWALLPIVGFSPETSFSGGAKFRESDLFGWKTILDLQGSYALEQQQEATFLLEDPHVFDSAFSLGLEAAWSSDPAKEFFGIGNDSEGPDEQSSHLFQDASARLSLGVWLSDHVRYRFSTAIRQVEVGRTREKSQGATSTRDGFPDLTGIEGGQIRSFRLDLVYDQHPGELRPIDGWVVAGFVEEVGPSLANEFNFTFYSVEVSRLVSPFGERCVAALRARAQYVEGVTDEIPFFVYPSLGGADTLRGYFPERFIGRGSALANVELRLRLVSFDFFDVWQVTIDGAAFGDFGRVYEKEEASSQEVIRDWKSSWGGGVRFFLSSGLVARVDVGFSDEEQALTYLRFGQMF